MHSDRPNLKSASRQAAGKVFRYALAAILLLSLPTFSYFVPKSQERTEQRTSGFEPGKDLRSSGPQATYRSNSMPSGFYGARGFSKRSSSRLVKRNNPRKRTSSKTRPRRIRQGRIRRKQAPTMRSPKIVLRARVRPDPLIPRSATSMTI